MNLSAVKIHDISIIALALVLILALYSLFPDVALIALILFLIILAIVVL